MKTYKMKKVMIALDYDPTAQKVAEAGYALAKTMNAEIVLLHIISDIVYYYSSNENTAMTGFTGYMGADPLQMSTIEDLQKASQHFLDKVKKHLGEDNILTIVKEGDLAASILNTAKEIDADIIVQGSHSRRWLENIIMGSVTEKVLLNTSIPLFIVPTKNAIEANH